MDLFHGMGGGIRHNLVKSEEKNVWWFSTNQLPFYLCPVSALTSGSTNQKPVSSWHSKPTKENHCTRAQGYYLSWCRKEKKRKTWATSNPRALSITGLVLTRTQSYHAGPFLHEEVDRMCLRCMPVILLISLGAWNVATAELKTWILSLIMGRESSRMSLGDTTESGKSWIYKNFRTSLGKDGVSQLCGGPRYALGHIFSNKQM